MGDVIRFERGGEGRENLIVDRPIAFRRGDWAAGEALLCLREESRNYEAHRAEAPARPGHRHIRSLPNAFKLGGGCHYTALGLYRHRENEAAMRRVYRLAGCMECVTGVPTPVLRTDLLRRFYDFILSEREALQVAWRGSVDRYLLPLHRCHYSHETFFNRAAAAPSLKDLFQTIEAETGRQFDLLAAHYVIYVPESFGA
jgi:hypothetical protein